MANGHGGARPGGGRPKGRISKDSADIRAMVQQALTMVGGANYLAQCAHTHTAAFLGLVGRVLPLQIADRSGEPISIDIRWAPAISDDGPPLIEGQADAPDSTERKDRDTHGDSTETDERDAPQDSNDVSDRTDYRNVQKDRAA